MEKEPPRPEKTLTVGCLRCHEDIVPDKNHSFACTACHKGDNSAAEKDRAHSGLIAQPAHPHNFKDACGKCHEQQVKTSQEDLHYTLANMVNLTRSHFGNKQVLPSLNEIPQHSNVEILSHLVDDMLRRRCLRCHLFSSGDTYPYVARGTGCAACHMLFEKDKLQSHSFAPPGDRQCLSCHYGNYVGSDYNGKFENDYNWEYRTPYATREAYLRPYGVEQYNLSPDIHQQKGLICIDCHSASGHKPDLQVQCITCHQVTKKTPLPETMEISRSDTEIYLTGKADGKRRKIPQLAHPAHEKYGDKVDCQVCHGQWSYNDSTTHLLRTEDEDYDIWERLTVQGSHEVEMLLEHNLYSDEDELPPTMRDGVTGEAYPGIWLKGFTQRRWEQMLTGRDIDGKIKVFRPILNIRLSMITEDEEVPFDNASSSGNGLRPYTPHTTGPAGLFYTDRFLHLLNNKPLASPEN